MNKIIPLILCLILLVSCGPTDNSKQLDEWKQVIQENAGQDSEVSKTITECENAAQKIKEECSSHNGWWFSNIIEITDFASGDEYDFKDEDNGGCKRPEDSVKYPPKATNAGFDSAVEDADSSYQFLCNVQCLSWNCPGMTQEASLDVNDLDCPTISGFTPGNHYNPEFSGAREVIQPTLLNSYGREAGLSCSYYRDSGEREWSQYGDGEIMYEGAPLRADFQVDGSFSDRPDWAIGNLCTGTEEERLRGTHVDIFSNTHVASVTYVTYTDFGNDISGIMKAAAKKLLKEIEQGYAIACSS